MCHGKKHTYIEEENIKKRSQENRNYNQSGYKIVSINKY